MNKAETLEIKKQFTPDRCAIDHICGCYVDHDKNKLFTFRKAFGQLPEEEMFKYLDIFQHTLAGTFGKNLISLEFPLDQEQPGGTQDFLLTLRNSQLQDDELVDEFYDKIIANYVNGENYYIILIHAAYDIPGITSDGIEMEDASENVYDYILCSICPVKLSKAGLGYNERTNVIEERFRDWIVDGPTKGFLFPAFIERDTDIHNMLYFTKKPDDLQPEFIEAMFGGRAPLAAPEQKGIFDTVVQNTIGENADYDIMKNIHDNLNDMIEDHADDAEPLELKKNDVKQLLHDSGVSDERLDYFDETYTKCAGDEDYPLLASNIANTKKFDIETPNVVIKVKPDRTDLVESKIVDGRQCLVIAVDDHIEVNGINVRTFMDR
ncbi:protein of unknown function [Butyrivibrio hungatei]|jgi:hypothetical protein|uniref:DUF4317 domain-containing protein n=1 Tax=Butyrivibrio hungatei TaxID=185008 RepID=A0A1G5DKP9_9FIRM|nr:DUF4317 domain-containing protein [Butyrivibrio hungatei]MBQ4221003.1 DUF4317 domain-containing protein [Butyrivibrio sp.]MEE3471418.1 DUF4317 domain-containing protein [Butyrivibrio hungatei]SCY15275.1 protein of unknown function [Butyrivibrio hungatei]